MVEEKTKGICGAVVKAQVPGLRPNTAATSRQKHANPITLSSIRSLHSTSHLLIVNFNCREIPECEYLD